MSKQLNMCELEDLAARLLEAEEQDELSPNRRGLVEAGQSIIRQAELQWLRAMNQAAKHLASAIGEGLFMSSPAGYEAGEAFVGFNCSAEPSDRIRSLFDGIDVSGDWDHDEGG